MAINRLTPGETIRNTYRVESFLGSGSFADVYLVSHRYLGRQAMKVFKPQNTGNDIESLLNEARTLVDLSHENIVRLYDANVDSIDNKSFAFVTMEWCRGGTFSDFIRKNPQMSSIDVVNVGIKVCEGLKHSHAMDSPLLHLDIKPDNLLLYDRSPSLKIKIGDYGLASYLSPLTRLSHSAGTLAFAAPEMAWGVLDQRADIYSLAVTLYKALCGMHPYPVLPTKIVSEKSSFWEILSHGRKAIAPPSKMLMGSNRQLDEILLKALAYDPFERFRNVDELQLALLDVKKNLTA